MNTLLTATAVEKMRRWAKGYARENSLSYNQALEQAARDAGFASWHEVQERLKAAAPPAQAADLPVDPVLPPDFEDTANEQRSKADLDTWWLRPFAQTREDGTLDVRCLDGGAHDRPTYYGTARDLAEARELAQKKLSAWLEVRDRPAVLLGATACLLVLEPNRPGMPRPVLLSAGRGEDLSRVLARWDETRERDPETAKLAIAAVRERSSRLPSYDAVHRAVDRGVAATLRSADGILVDMPEAALVCTIHAFGGADAGVDFTLPEIATYLWEFGIDEENAAQVLHRARRLEFDGRAVIADAKSVVKDGVDHWNVRLAPSRWLVARGFRKF